MELGNRISEFSDLMGFVDRIEDLGFYGVYYGDGLHWTNYECWNVLSAIAISTKKLRIGPAMSFLSHRHPALMAKTAATIDVISGGRLEFRLGAGDLGVRNDSRLLGIPLLSPGERVLQLKEGLDVVNLLWSHDSSSYHGKFYSLSDAAVRPKPIQRPRPPITIAGGRRRMLELCVESADGWEALDTNPVTYQKAVDHVKELCRAKDRSFSKIRRSQEVFLGLGDDQQLLKKTVRLHAQRIGLSPDHPWIGRWVVGSAESCRDFFSRFSDLGVDQFVVIPVTDDLHWFIEEFSKEILDRIT